MSNSNETASCINKFRLNNHGLQIENGRYTQHETHGNERICLHCNLNEIGNKLHFLLLCPCYDDERSVLLNVVNTIAKSIIGESVPNTFFIIITVGHQKRETQSIRVSRTKRYLTDIE